MSATTKALSVSCKEGPRCAAAVDAVVASLPVSFRHASTDEVADVVVIDGAAGWVRRAIEAIEGGAQGLLIVAPGVEETAGLRAAVEARGTVVVVDRLFAANPAMAEAADAFRALDAPHALLEVRLSLPRSEAPGDALLEHLALTRAVAGPLSESKTLVLTENGYAIRGIVTEPDRRRVLLSAIVTNARERGATLRLLGANGAVELTVPDPVTARPAALVVTSAAGATLLPTLYETAHRASWRRIRALLTPAEPAARRPRVSDLEELAADIVVARALAG